MFTLILLILLYFLPTIVASHRGRGVAGILILNLLLGWTCIGWLVLLLWALLARPRYYCVPGYGPYYGNPYYGWRRY
jgi:hypothetical protein